MKRHPDGSPRERNVYRTPWVARGCFALARACVALRLTRLPGVGRLFHRLAVWGLAHGLAGWRRSIEAATGR